MNESLIRLVFRDHQASRFFLLSYGLTSKESIKLPQDRTNLLRPVIFLRLSEWSRECIRTVEEV